MFRTTLALICCMISADAVARSAVEKPAKTVYDYSLVGPDNKEVRLSTFKGKVLVIVNLASQSVFHDQITQLEEMQKAYEDKGLVVIGIPCNDFGTQEPGTDTEIQKKYHTDLHVTFSVFARASVRGKDQAALYEFLTSDKKGTTGGDVHWSYTKFIVDRTGKVVARFEPHIAPNSPELQVTLEEVLAGKFKPPAKKAESEDDQKAASDREEDSDR